MQVSRTAGDLNPAKGFRIFLERCEKTVWVIRYRVSAVKWVC
jgi:hypothetical protein